jgi:uncharacterized protein (DUF983 family)
MKVTRGQILVRGVSHQCPNCGGRTLFKSGRYFELNKNCRDCGLEIERDEGFYLGAVSLNYGVTVVLILVPVALIYLAGWLSGFAASLIAGLIAIFVPVLFYRSSRSWWLANYYVFFPHHLPANQRQLADNEDANT